MRSVAALRKSFQFCLAVVSILTLEASSHREAPSVAHDPAVDITDVYVFKTPGSTETVTFMVNVAPTHQNAMPINSYAFADDALYELHIDNTGDGVEDVTYRFQFKTPDYRAAEGQIFANFPQIKFESGKYTGCLLCQTYKVTKIVGKRRKGTATVIASDLNVAPPRIGPATTDGGTPFGGGDTERYNAYKTLADNAINITAGYKFFVGPRNDPAFIDHGTIFDRLSFRPNARNLLAGANVLSIVFEAPIAEFSSTSKFFGTWATASLPQAMARRLAGKAVKSGGPYVQVSRVGNPLVNQLLIKLKDKDKFNNTEPKDDNANYAGYLTSPQLAYYFNLLYGPVDTDHPADKKTNTDFVAKIDESNRADVVTLFVDGIAEMGTLGRVNKHPSATQNAGDMIRTNLDFSLQEWPFSGRGLKEDVVAVTLRFIAQCDKFTANSKVSGDFIANPMGKIASPTTPPKPANCNLDDGITADDATVGGSGTLASFPYLDLPFSSY